MTTIENLFFTASRKQLRFTTTTGLLSVEDLWTLNLKALDSLAVAIDNQLGVAGKSFLANPDRLMALTEKDNRLRLEILKVVIETKQEENAAKAAAATKAAQRDFLRGLLERKRVADLEGLPTADIEAQLAALEAEG